MNKLFKVADSFLDNLGDSAIKYMRLRLVSAESIFVYAAHNMSVNLSDEECEKIKRICIAWANDKDLDEAYNYQFITKF